MIKQTLMVALIAGSSSVLAETQSSTNAPVAPASISIQEMLVTGPSNMKLHSLAMITQGNVKDGVDERFLPGLTVCAKDSALPVRSVTAKLLGQYFIEGQEKPNPEAIILLTKLAADESADVRYNAIYHGLTQIKNKSPEVINQLIEVAAINRDQILFERIVQSLKDNRDQVIQILDKKLAEEDNIAIYEIYEDLTGQKPADSDKYLDMPSSRPHLFVIKGYGDDASVFKEELEKELASADIKNPTIQISGEGENYVLLLKTYITRDYQTAEKLLSDSEKFTLTQDMWLTPELEIQIETMRKAQGDGQ